ncbi:hypothetical protein ACFSO7_09610 [Bacillus sp. CGMCC 1.16607]|uniref:hypothetical protein n=1 Tax=Bacillus sp. CGMCC 1.16607 TaxID=3351842 RepID=UPI00363F62DF
MEQFINFMSTTLTNIHDYIILFTETVGLKISDKVLHFYILGIVGLMIFALADMLFKKLAKWSISFVTFTFSLTLVMIIAFVIEMEQKWTDSGNVEFMDIIFGLSGFMVILSIYLLIVSGVKLFVKNSKRKKSKYYYIN